MFSELRHSIFQSKRFKKDKKYRELHFLKTKRSLRLEHGLTQIENSSGDELELSSKSSTDSETEYCEAINTSEKEVVDMIKMTRGIQKASEKLLAVEKLKYAKWANKKLMLVPLPVIRPLKSIRYFDLHLPLDEQLFCDSQCHKLVNVYDISSFKHINEITYDVEKGIYQVNIQEKKFCKELYQQFQIQKNYYCSWLRSLATDKAFKMIQVQDEIEKTHMPGASLKLSLTYNSLSTRCPAEKERENSKKNLLADNDNIEDSDHTVDGDENTTTNINFAKLIGEFKNGQPYMTRLYRLEKINSNIENVLIQEEYSSNFMSQVLKLGDNYQDSYDFQAENGGFKTIFFDDMVNTLYKIHVQPDCQLSSADDDETLMSQNENISQCSYTALIVNDQKKCFYKLKNYKRFWKFEGCLYCKHFLTISY